MYVGDRYCITCREETTHHDMSCQVCAGNAAKEQSKKRRMDLAALTGLSAEERLARIEAQLYDLSITVAAVQSQTAQY